MDLKLNQRESEGIRILDLHGRLMIGEPESMLRTEIIALANAKDVNVILNLEGVTAIDDDGLGALVFCWARIASSGGALKLLSRTRLHLGLMVVTKLATVFEFFTNEQDAVDSFFPDRAVHPYDILEYVEEQEQRPAPPDRPK
jgi:anti-sigma B factor antagonist